MLVKRIQSLVLEFLLIVPVAEAKPQTRPPAESAAFYPVAVWYGGGKARAPMLEPVDASSAERWGKDLDEIKAVGFNTVKCWVDWATAEPRPQEYHFQNLDLLLKLARERGLRVIVQIYLDSAPDWVGQRYPDSRFVDRSGAVIESQAAPGYCIDHPAVRAEIVKFLKALSADANRSPALYGWDVWSEPHIVNWAEFPYLVHPEFCYCRYTQARFRRWLEAKYQTLASLNRSWYRGFTSWQQVEPPRASTILSYTDYLDWRTFLADKLAGDLKTRVDAVRSEDHTHPITSHAAVPGLFTSPMDGYGEPDDWKMAVQADFFGTSLYPKHAESARPWSYPMIAAGLDFTRSSGHSLGKGFWIGELQAGQGVTGMRIAQPVDSRDERYWMWQVLSHGAREMALYAWYPMNSGYESNGYGLIHLDGTLTERARAAGQVASIIENHAAELLGSRPAPAQVAVLYNPLSYMVGGEEASLSKLGNAERDSLMGTYHAFWERQIPVDFVHPEDVIANKLGAYKILFLPYPVMLSKSVAEGLVRYVTSGGVAVAEARLAWNDERGFASDVVPGFGLAQVFGAREKVIRPADQPRLRVEAPAGLAGQAGEAAVGEAFEEDLEPLEGARVLARFADEQPAIVEHSYGKGRAILVGTFLGLAFERHPGLASTRDLLLVLARAAGVEAPVRVSGAGTSEVEVRRLVSDRGEFLFAFNHRDQPTQASFSVDMPWPVERALSLTDGQTIPVETREGVSRFEKTLAGGEILVLRFERP